MARYEPTGQRDAMLSDPFATSSEYFLIAAQRESVKAKLTRWLIVAVAAASVVCFVLSVAALAISTAAKRALAAAAPLPPPQRPQVRRSCK